MLITMITKVMMMIRPPWQPPGIPSLNVGDPSLVFRSLLLVRLHKPPPQPQSNGDFSIFVQMLLERQKYVEAATFPFPLSLLYLTLMFDDCNEWHLLLPFITFPAKKRTTVFFLNFSISLKFNLEVCNQNISRWSVSPNSRHCAIQVVQSESQRTTISIQPNISNERYLNIHI